MYKYYYSNGQSLNGQDADYVHVGEEKKLYSECIVTSKEENEISNWKDAVLIAESETELETEFAPWHEFDEDILVGLN